MTRYIGRDGTSRVAEAVLLGAVPPLMLKTEANPDGLPIDAFDAIRAGVSADRSQFYKHLSAPFYGANRPGSTVSQGARDDRRLGLRIGDARPNATLKVQQHHVRERGGHGERLFPAAGLRR